MSCYHVSMVVALDVACAGCGEEYRSPIHISAPEVTIASVCPRCDTVEWFLVSLIPMEAEIHARKICDPAD